jgi:HAD superfamily hydrolase (TIGR01509 family)
VHWTLDGRIDVTGGAEQFGDDQLATLLGGQPLGRDLATLEQEIGSTVAEATSLRFTASLPGDEDGEWTVGLDDPAPTEVRLQGTVERTSVRLLAVVAAAAAGAFLLVLVVAVLRWRARRRGRRPDLWNDAPDEPFAPAVTPMPASAPPRRRQLQLVVTEAHGVLWESRVTAEEWLVNLVAMQGGTATRDEVGAVLREALVGRIRSRDIWRALGVPGETPHLDAAYVARFSLTPGVEDLVTALARRGIGLACLTNDVYEWSVLLRDRFGLDRSITPWIVSSDIGAAKPAAAMFDAVAAEAHLPLEHCLYLDDNLENLNAAKQLGMSTVLVAPRPGEARALGHGHVVTVRDLLRRRPGSVPT